MKIDILLRYDYNYFITPYLDFWLWRQICISRPIYYVEGCRTYWRKHDESYDMVEHVGNIEEFLLASNHLFLSGMKLPVKQRLKLFFRALHGKKKKLIDLQIRILQQYARQSCL